MADVSHVTDEELLLRHVPEGVPWQTSESPFISSANFELRHDRGETGVSVTRWIFTTPRQLLRRLAMGPGALVTPGSKIFAAKAGEVRALGFVVVEKSIVSGPVPDPGHAEIRSATASLDRRPQRQRLRNLFRLVDTSQYDTLQPH